MDKLKLNNKVFMFPLPKNKRILETSHCASMFAVQQQLLQRLEQVMLPVCHVSQVQGLRDTSQEVFRLWVIFGFNLHWANCLQHIGEMSIVPELQEGCLKCQDTVFPSHGSNAGGHRGLGS